MNKWTNSSLFCTSTSNKAPCNENLSFVASFRTYSRLTKLQQEVLKCQTFWIFSTRSIDNSNSLHKGSNLCKDQAPSSMCYRHISKTITLQLVLKYYNNSHKHLIFSSKPLSTRQRSHACSTVVLQCYRRQAIPMEQAKIRPSETLYSLDRSLSNLVWCITSATPTRTLILVEFGWVGNSPQIREI